MPQYSRDEVANTFKEFGVDYTPAELGMFEGLDHVGGRSSIANYVNTKSAQMKAEANNPLKSFLEEEKIRRTGFESKAEGLYQQLQDTLSAAPKLFGNLSPEQIGQYLAPITQAAREGSANLEGNYARRGIAGSSIEANALADAQRKYQENVLNTGLNLGMNTQQAQASAIQNRINQMFNASSGSSNLLGSGFGQLSTEQQSNLQSITQLPMFLRAMANQELLFKKSMEPGKMSWVDDLGKFSQGVGNINSIIDNVTKIGSKFVPMPGAGGAGAPPEGLI